MNDKIEAAAKAIFERQRQNITVPLEWCQLSLKTQDSYKEDARVAFDVFGELKSAQQALKATGINPIATAPVEGTIVNVLEGKSMSEFFKGLFLVIIGNIGINLLIDLVTGTPINWVVDLGYTAISALFYVMFVLIFL
jgi:hypothetical protein